MKRIALISSISLGLSLLAAPAAACDMHGAGGFHGAFGSSWSTYSPPDFSDEYTPIEQALEKVDTQIDAQKKKPTFSNFATRASRMAKTRIAERTEAKTKDDTSSKAVKQVALKTKG